MEAGPVWSSNVNARIALLLSASILANVGALGGQRSDARQESAGRRSWSRSMPAGVCMTARARAATGRRARETAIEVPRRCGRQPWRVEMTTRISFARFGRVLPERRCRRSRG